MREKPILFSAPMVRAILDGRKTQTRRIMKPQPTEEREPLCATVPAEVGPVNLRGPSRWTWVSAKCRSGMDVREVAHLGPYGAPGDRLWIRETFRSPSSHIVGYQATGECGAWMHDGAGGRIWVHHGWMIGDGCPRPPDDGRPIRSFGASKYGDRWCPSIHMPRWASRITLAVESVRVERLHDISEDDARAEGVAPMLGSYVAGFAALWTQINGTRPGADWNDCNPWVWVVDFRRVEESRDA